MAERAVTSGLRDIRNVCQLCGALENLSLCGGCRETSYCCKEHQREDWKAHKKRCKEIQKHKQRDAERGRDSLSGSDTGNVSNPFLESSYRHRLKGTEHKSDTVTSPDPELSQAIEEYSQSLISQTPQDLPRPEVSSQANTTENEPVGVGATRKELAVGQVPLPVSSQAEENSVERFFLDANFLPNTLQSTHLNRARFSASTMAPDGTGSSSRDSNRAYVDILMSRFDATAKYVVECLNTYGICVMDSFLGEINGNEIFAEVKKFKKSGIMKQGQLVHSGPTSSVKIRGDIITWVDGRETKCDNIRYLVSCMDAVVLKTSKLMDGYTINERTKAMVACYPGKQSGYVRHVDNPNEDGRCITCIYYLNKDWDVDRDGGMLRIYPEGMDRVADIEPKFDRVLFFWSDRRNPHEVLPAYRERYAITVWYYEAKERARALKRHNIDKTGETMVHPKKQSVPLFDGSQPNHGLSPEFPPTR